jgi:hypothetical protein
MPTSEPQTRNPWICPLCGASYRWGRVADEKVRAPFQAFHRARKCLPRVPLDPDGYQDEVKD